MTSYIHYFVQEELFSRCLESARESILERYRISSPDSFTSRMKSVVTPVVQVSSRLEIYSTASHFT